MHITNKRIKVVLQHQFHSIELLSFYQSCPLDKDRRDSEEISMEIIWPSTRAKFVKADIIARDRDVIIYDEWRF